MANGEFFTLDQKKLNRVLKQLCEAATKGEGIFRHGLGYFLPQWNLPSSLEFDPIKKDTKNPLKASKYLFTMASLERKALTREHIKNAKRVWKMPGKRWVFDQEEVRKRPLEEIRKIFTGEFAYSINNFSLNYQINSTILAGSYNGDPRKIVQGKTVEKARQEMMSFKGIGTGIANLFILYLLERRIASPVNPQNILLKVDVHKARIPINTRVIRSQYEEVRREQLVPALEKAYWQACKDESLDPAILDAALWTIGSEVCAKRNYEDCQSHCCLVDRVCISNVPEDENTSKFRICQNGERVDTRKNKDQVYMEFFSEVPVSQKKESKDYST